MYEELTKQLRWMDDVCKKDISCPVPCITECLFKEAADAIEKLSMRIHGDEAAIAGMKREIERMVVADKPRWIPVTEQLPEENGRYLTTMYRTVDSQYRNELGNDDTEVRITRYCKGEWKVPLHSPKWIDEAITDIVTHWMTLPELPKDGET